MSEQLWLGLAALVVIAIGIIWGSKQFSAKLSKKGLDVSSSQKPDKDETFVKQIKNNSDIEIDSPKGRNINVEEVDNSTVKIKK